MGNLRHFFKLFSRFHESHAKECLSSHAVPLQKQAAQPQLLGKVLI